MSLGVVAGAAVLFELTLTRLISVALWYPFAFVALGLAVLGFGVAAAALAVWPRLRQGKDEPWLAGGALGFSVAVAGGYPLWNSLPLQPMSLSTDPSQWWWFAVFLLLIGLPFVGAGLFISRLFIASPAQAPLLYGVDLIGAAAGVLVYVSVEPSLGAPGTLLVAAALGVLAALLAWVPPVPVRLGVAVLGIGLISLAPQLEEQLPLRLSQNKLLGTDMRHHTRGPTLWSVSSAIDVLPRADGLHLIIDGGTAMTMVPRAPARRQDRLQVPPPTGLRALPYLVRPRGSTLVIGAGGGMEVKAALGAGAERIVAVEIDSTITRLVSSELAAYHGGLFARPQVEHHTAEARGFLERTDERFDIIVAFHTISNAASSSGALSLAESYLLTEEALTLQLEHLTDGGVLLISRPEAQLGRLVHMLARAARTSSLAIADISSHTLVVAHGNERPAFLSAVVFSAFPLGPDLLDTLVQATPGRVLYLPARPATGASAGSATKGGGDEQEYISAALRGEHQTALALHPEFADLRPATDDRPFFNMFKSWSAIGRSDFAALFGAGVGGRYRLEDLPMGQLAILMLLLVATGLALVALLPCAWMLARSQVNGALAAKTSLVFGVYGFSFMVVEVVLVQRLTRIVGEPGWSLVVVLSLLLAASGVGGYWFAGKKQWRAAHGALAAAGAALACGIVLPWILDSVAGWPTLMRIAAAGGAVSGSGLLLGIPFSATLRALALSENGSTGASPSGIAPASSALADTSVLTAWAWAVSSFTSVFGSVAALIVSSAWGLSAAACLAAMFYLLAAYALRRGIAAERR